jgi:integrase
LPGISVAGCKFETLADVEGEAVQTLVRQLKVDDGFGNRTYNHYLQAMDAFCNWCVVSKRLFSNPILGLERLNTAVDVRHPRRSLSADEVTKLIHSAETSLQRIQRFLGKTRARIYRLAYMTGLRKKELASLTPASFRLDAKPPTVTVEAACSKHRRKDVLPLHPELVAHVRQWIKGMRTNEKLFPKLEGKKTWLMVKKDLERVGIQYETVDGIADFHAAGRHTHITQLLRNGATLAEARELARHSDVRMTMRYTHIGLNDQARALASLPSPKQQPADNADQKSTSTHAASQQTSQQTVGPDRQTGSTRDSVWQTAQKKPEASSTAASGTYDASGQSPAEPGTDSAEWRRRELNPWRVLRETPPLCHRAAQNAAQFAIGSKVVRRLTPRLTLISSP